MKEMFVGLLKFVKEMKEKYVYICSTNWMLSVIIVAMIQKLMRSWGIICNDVQ